jgi:hypothetical protein
MDNTNNTTRDVQINTLSIINAKGKVVDISNIFNIINIYEDIFNSTITGTIQLFDGVDLFAQLELQGNEYLFISFNRPGENKEEQKYKRSFRIFKANERKPDKASSQTYVLHFCSEELLFSNQKIISRSFKNDTNTNYVYNICSNDLRINSKKLNSFNFEQSIGQFNSVLTQYKPLEAIQYFASQSYNSNESTFLFFENREGFNFLSLEKLFNRSSVVKLDYSSAKFTEDSTTSAFVNSNKITSFKFDKAFDMHESLKKSTYSGSLYTVDILTQKYNKLNYSLLDSSPRNFMDNFLPTNFAKNRNEKSAIEEFDTNIKYSITNRNQTNSPYISSKAFRVIDTNVENTLMQRESQLSLLKNTILDVIVSGNQAFSVGYIVELDMPAFTTNLDNVKNLDPFYSGKYLITHIRHIITPSGGHQTLMKLAKNSPSSPYEIAYGNNESYKKARNL